MKPLSTRRSNLAELLEAEYREDLAYIDKVRDEQERQLEEMNRPPQLETIWPKEP